MGVRNKYFAVCHNATVSTIPGHNNCFLNWDQSSLAMEIDIIVKGFCQSEAQYGLTKRSFFVMVTAQFTLSLSGKYHTPSRSWNVSTSAFVES